MQQSPQKEKRYKGQGRDASKGKEKFQQQRIIKASSQPLLPMNEKQKGYIRALEEGVSVIVATGYAGSSKTFIPTKWVCNKFLNNNLYKFVLSRPAISNSKSLGFFTGDHIEKISIWLTPVLSTIKETLGKEETDLAIKREDITFIPLEVVKGLSLSSNDPNRPIVFLIDEAEDLTKDEVIKLITRVGKNCILILAGDVLQSELKEKSGLKWLIDFMQKHKLPSENFFHVDFNHVNDIVRSDVVKNFITCLQRDEKQEKKELN